MRSDTTTNDGMAKDILMARLQVRLLAAQEEMEVHFGNRTLFGNLFPSNPAFGEAVTATAGK